MLDEIADQLAIQELSYFYEPELTLDVFKVQMKEKLKQSERRNMLSI